MAASSEVFGSLNIRATTNSNSMALSELLVDLPLVSSGMSTFQITAIYLVTGFLSWYIISSVAAWHRLKDFPGPSTTGFSNIWAARVIWTGKAHEALVEAQEKYGSITRIGPNALMVSDAESAVTINGIRGGYSRPKEFYDVIRMDPWDHTVFSETNSAKHSDLRTKLYSGYQGKGEMDMEKDVNMVVSQAVDLVRTKYMQSATSGSKEPLDFSKITRYIAVDSVTQAGFGKAWGNVPDEKDHFGWLGVVDLMVQGLNTLAFLPDIHRILLSSPLMAAIGPKPTDKSGMGRFLGLIEQEVARRFKNGEERGQPIQTDVGHSNMLDEWVKNGVSQRTAYLEVSAQLCAGTETVASALQGTMFYLLSTPSAYLRLREEIATGISEGRISSPITNEEARKLSYLQAVLNEGIRMMPPVMNGFPRRVPPQGDTICGRFVPGGTDVHINYLGMLQDKSVFGQDAHVFRPDRYLEGDEAHRNRLFQTTDLAFSHGRWKCMGQKLAWLQLQKVFVEFLRNFDLQIPDQTNPCKLKVHCMPKMKDLMVTVTEARLD